MRSVFPIFIRFSSKGGENSICSLMLSVCVQETKHKLTNLAWLRPELYLTFPKVTALQTQSLDLSTLFNIINHLTERWIKFTVETKGCVQIKSPESDVCLSGRADVQHLSMKCPIHTSQTLLWFWFFPPWEKQSDNVTAFTRISSLLGGRYVPGLGPKGSLPWNQAPPRCLWTPRIHLLWYFMVGQRLYQGLFSRAASVDPVPGNSSSVLIIVSCEPVLHHQQQTLAHI